MAESTIQQEEASEGHRLLPAERPLIWSASTGSVLYMTVIGSVPAMFLLKGLDARPFYIGLLSTLCSITPVGMLLGTVLVGRLGKVRLLILGRLACLLPTAAMIVLAALGIRGERIIWLAILSAAMLALLNNIGATGWWPLLQDNVPPDLMGRFFARMRTRLRSVEIGIPLALGLVLGEKPSMQLFVVPFALGALAMLAGAHIQRRLPEQAISPPDVNLLLRLRLAWRARHVRSYVMFIALLCLLMGMFGPFWMVLLTAGPGNPFVGLPTGFVVWLSAVAAIGHMLSLKLWARLVDSHGGRGASSLCLILSAVWGLGWLLLPAQAPWTYVWALVFYFAWGMLDGGALMGRTWSMLRSVPVAYQSDGFTLVQLAAAAGGAAGALLGGWVFDALTQASLSGYTLRGLDPRTVYLCASQGALLLAYLASRRLVNYQHQTPTAQLLRQAWQRLATPGEG